MDVLLLIPMLVVVIIVFFYLGWIFNSKIGKKNILSAETEAKRIVEDAEKESKNIKREKLLEVKDEWYKKKTEFDKEVNQKRQKLSQLEKQLQTREENSEKKFDLILQKERENKKYESELNEEKKIIEKRTEEINRLEEEQNLKLEKISGLTSEEAKKMLMDNLVNQAKIDATVLIKEIMDKAKSDAKKEAQKIIVQSIQRSAADHSIETTVSVVQIQNDEMKGRIIGKEGRNIRAFESSTGVDVIVDDTPEAVILSSFDQFRREIARVSLERLIADGRIHPARIEEVISRVVNEFNETIYDEGEKAVLSLGIVGIPAEGIVNIGKLHFRTSYGQNVLNHAIEVAKISGTLAAELGGDVTLAKRAGLMHDLGKGAALDGDSSHTEAGYELAKKMGEPDGVLNAIISHHGDAEPNCLESIIVQIADAISASRPGARRESLESYIKRLENLELIAESYEGVEKAFAIQAGREVRVILNNTTTSDDDAGSIAKEVAKRIETELRYPGKIKVTVIRESRFIEYAR